MNILGLAGGLKLEWENDPFGWDSHDAAAVLMQDNLVIAAAEEERFNRVKHYNGFPVQSIQYCLQEGNIALSDIDIIAINTSFGAPERGIADPNESGRIEVQQILNQIDQIFFRFFGISIKNKLRTVDHHLAHAWSAYYPSGFSKSLVFTVDGSGDGLCNMLLTAVGNELKVIQEYPESQSLGHWYQEMIGFLGYSRFDEYKVMGLAPTGNPDTFRSLFSKSYRLGSKGSYELLPVSQFKKNFETFAARKKGEPFTQVHRDFAACLQESLETIVFHILTYFRESLDYEYLCLAGGVAHNCTLNGKLLYSKLFKDIFVQPAAHDAGGALGAAIAVNQLFENTRKRTNFHLYLGDSIPQTKTEIEAELSKWESVIQFKIIEPIEKVCARLLAEGNVIAWVQGRAEFGPRALGNRSILADPRPVENKDRINKMVKKREGYRPFAPSVCEESAHLFFEMPPNNSNLPYMIFVLNVRPEKRNLLGAITHVDGSARVQTVSQEQNPSYWRLIHEFGEITKIPMLLNTSFNNNSEPIVNNIQDALTCFLTTDLDYLVIGNYLISKDKAELLHKLPRFLIPQVPLHRKLVKSSYKDETGSTVNRYICESTKSKYFCKPITISEQAFLTLIKADGNQTLEDLIPKSFAQETYKAVINEVFDLWSLRAISHT